MNLTRKEYYLILGAIAANISKDEETLQYLYDSVPDCVPYDGNFNCGLVSDIKAEIEDLKNIRDRLQKEVFI